VNPRLWVGLVPFGIGRTKPHHFLEADPVALVPDYNAVVEVRRA
jgi:hypothetical protein